MGLDEVTCNLARLIMLGIVTSWGWGVGIILAQVVLPLGLVQPIVGLERHFYVSGEQRAEIWKAESGHIVNIVTYF